MDRLQKFVERRAYSGDRVRTAYALSADKLPAPRVGARWHPVDDFNAADELLENASLKRIYQLAITDGCAVLPPGDEQ
jgi:hypothetical protein